MSDQAYAWDFFLAHAGADGPQAKELFHLLSSPSCRVFLDSECLLLGDDWDLELARAQCASRITVVLVSERAEKAYYQREEIAAAIAMAREDKEKHRVVPVYLDESIGPYGLRLKHGLSTKHNAGLGGVAERLLDLLGRVSGDVAPPALQPERAAVSAYKTDLLRALDRDFQLPTIEFGLTITAPNSRTLSVSELISETELAKRIVLRASAGAGKSMIAGKLARLLLEAGFLPFVLNLKNWQKNRHSVRLAEPSRGFQDRLSLLLEVSIVDLCACPLT